MKQISRANWKLGYGLFRLRWEGGGEGADGVEARLTELLCVDMEMGMESWVIDFNYGLRDTGYRGSRV